ncbi:hypothetical protein PC116_g19944 [Phytophthora cactorum]|uniref:Secreted protein n=1 Tax=Phytophthora cactorum TaxID=29920 RepID=A0A8T1EW06_9STRA|nr:hypothetical protein PC112_g21719 [Phytophthora cactorum]KAG2797843.1 hypothetical protein PC111_g21110 [Phytophthora cactorum]KAG2830225.1 hypothetical protein PC113_g21142 [Phytophthora cactorum]KAG2885735.1 hypothetical protein PC115_g20909 [Phytophthora cactorum]KAG2895055.1 hypothetical protein PC117_g23333 [Phytophthora cactorum]
MAACMLYCTGIVTFAVIWAKAHYDQNHIVVNTEGYLYCASLSITSADATWNHVARVTRSEAVGRKRT